MKKLGIIPARMNSSRFPGKPLVEIHNKSVIQRVYEQASFSNLDEVIVATSDDEIINHCIEKKLKFKRTLGRYSSGTERCSEFLENLNHGDILVNIQGDEPFIKPESINSILNYFEIDNFYPRPLICSLITSITEQEAENTNTVKVIKDFENYSIYFSRQKIPFRGPWYKHIGVYGFEASALKSICGLPRTKIEESESLEQLRWIYYRYPINLIEVNYNPLSINVKEDLP